MIIRAYLVVYFSFSILLIYCATPFEPIDFWLKNKLIGLQEFSCILFVEFPSLILISFSNLFHITYVVSWWVCLVFILYWTVCTSWIWCNFLSQVMEMFSYNVFKYIFSPFLTYLWIQMVCLMLSQKSIKLSSFLFFFFFFIFFTGSCATSLSSRIVTHSSVPFSLLLILVCFSFQSLHYSPLLSCSLYFLNLW